MKPILPAIAAICLFPTFAMADQVDRLAAATDILTGKLTAFYVSRVPELADAMPNFTVDAEMRAALGCTLDTYTAEIGPNATEAYVASVEAEAAALEITSLSDMGNMLGDIDEALALRAMQECGQMDISMRRMQESGLLQALQKPGVMEALLAGE
ncbi:hypothetical protein AB3Y40_03400 [Yoonia sp. R2331]|uniref:hypothetical protein n=1 Tax=Yoonia sp. R2331 TaxID=3237238 RepID=UPI0034E5E32A